MQEGQSVQRSDIVFTHCAIIIFLIGKAKRIREGKQLAQGHTAGTWGQLSTVSSCSLPYD